MGIILRAHLPCELQGALKDSLQGDRFNMRISRRRLAGWNRRHVLTAGLGICIAASLAAARQLPNKLTHNEATEGYKLLFNGKNLDGWQPLATFSAPATGDWFVSDGAIVCPGTTSGWLANNHRYSNFELRLEFRGAETTNSGVFLRSSKEGQPHVTGYELQIWDYQKAGYRTGSLVGSLKAQPIKILGNQWNRYDITADGDHYKVVLNGKTILNGNDSKHSAGVIGFQCQKNNRIEFRNIRIRELIK
jgi:hypothetical protein